MKCCCDWLERLMREREDRGLAIVPIKSGSRRYFVVRANAFSAKDYGYLNQSTVAVDRTRWPVITDVDGNPMSWMPRMQVAVRHCPSCGALLSDLIATDPRAFDAIAEGAE